MGRKISYGFAAIAGLSAITLMVFVEPAPAAITGLTRVANGLSAPMFVTHAPGDRSRLFIAERGSPSNSTNATASIRILDLNTGTLLPDPFLTITGINNNFEGGLLGMAFHPDYSVPDTPGFGKFYVKMTTTGSTFNVRVREYEVSGSNPNDADESSVRQVLSYTNPAGNHVGGWIGFSPNDEYLYIANGDGGGGNDDGPGHTDEPTVKGNAQDITNNWLGKMLRIDPLDPDGMGPATYSVPPTNPMVADVGSPADDVGDDEIWSYGLRNPFRASFDRITGDLWIGDVGQGAREEVDFQPGTSAGGENYGWRLREGAIQTPTSGIGGPCPGCVEPAYDYGRPDTDPEDLTNQYTGTTVIGGYVYRGPDPSLQGQYLFLDRSAGSGGINYWRFDPDDPYDTVQNIDSLMIPNTGSASGAVSMGEDAVGNLYIAYFSGNVYRIATNELIPGDLNADGEVDDLDLAALQQSFGRTGANLAADANKDGAVNAADYVLVRKLLGTSVHDGAGSGSGQVPEPSVTLLLIPILAMMFVRGQCAGVSR